MERIKSSERSWDPFQPKWGKQKYRCERKYCTKYEQKNWTNRGKKLNKWWEKSWCEQKKWTTCKKKLKREQQTMYWLVSTIYKQNIQNQDHCPLRLVKIPLSKYSSWETDQSTDTNYTRMGHISFLELNIGLKDLAIGNERLGGKIIMEANQVSTYIDRRVHGDR